ncbi:conserved hypothetical protein [Trichinella spiralis]|uniref:hypothetical protein n=1 Tax=Trichinella spiralis TaxID=6334 RepID=UPI0001EFD97C|nr:conserved hypothetical protein [Trichinella spiralis]
MNSKSVSSHYGSSTNCKEHYLFVRLFLIKEKSKFNSEVSELYVLSCTNRLDKNFEMRMNQVKGAHKIVLIIFERDKLMFEYGSDFFHIIAMHITETFNAFRNEFKTALIN